MFKVNIKNTWLFFLLLFKVRRKDTLTTPMASKKLNREALLSLFLRFNIIRSLILSSKLNPFRENALICFSTFQYSATFSFYSPWKRQETKGFLLFSGGIENAAGYWKALKQMETFTCIKYVKHTTTWWEYQHTISSP